MRLRSAIQLATGVLALAGCSLLTDLSDLTGGPETCDGGACTDAPPPPFDARGDADGDGGVDAAPCVPTDTIAPSLLSDAVALALGQSFSCALRSNATVACWGDNGEGVLGVQGGDRPTAGTVPGLSRIVAISAGLAFVCALDADGHVWCWGSNKSGQLGSGPPDPGTRPPAMVTVPSTGQPLSKVTAISAGEQHVCAIVGGAVWCWGANDAAQLGRPPGSSAPAAVGSVLPNPVEIECSGTASCAIADTMSPGAATKALYCWGGNASDQLAMIGGNTPVAQRIPVTPGATGPYPVLTSGHGHICSRDTKDGLWCWGENDFGQLGPNVPPGDSPVPRSIDAFGLVRMAAAGDDYTCAISHDGTTRCLGENVAAQLGNGTSDVPPGDGGLPPPHTIATQVSGLPKASRIFAGVAHTCAILARSCPDVAGAVMCWGANASGQLGNGSIMPTKVPVSVLAP